MHKFRIMRITLAVLCALPLAAAAQEGLKLKSQPSLILIPPSNTDEVPLFIEADTLRGRNDKETEAEGDAKLRKRGKAIFADWLRYDKPEDEITAVGNVRIDQRGDVTEGDRLHFNLETERGFMDKPRYTLTPAAPVAPPVTGSPPFAQTDAAAPPSACCSKDRDSTVRCRRLHDLRAGQQRLVHPHPGPADRQGPRRRRGARCEHHFHGLPIFYSPYLSFSLHQERKSGFLTPTYGSTSRSGAEFTVPYYWNIAPIAMPLFRRAYLPNAACSLIPNSVISTRATEGRCTSSIYPTITLPAWTAAPFPFNIRRRCPTAGADRSICKGYRTTDISPISRPLPTITSQVVLPREGSLGRGGTWGQSGTYSFSALVQRWQTLQVDPLAPITSPYSRQPQLTLTAYNQNILRGDLDFIGNFVDFNHPTLVNGKRYMAYPSLSLPLQNSYAYVTPKIGLNVAHYALDKSTTTLPNATRALPIFSAESGLVLERDTQRLRATPDADAGTQALLRLYPVPRPEPDPEFRERHAGHQFSRRFIPKTSSAATIASTMPTRSRWASVRASSTPTTGSNACAWAWPSAITSGRSG